MDATLAALLGAAIGGILSVIASWIAQRVQSKSQWLVQEIKQRQQLYSEFLEAASSCFAEALQANDPNSPMLAKMYAEIGRMRLVSSALVVNEAHRIAHKILDAYSANNRSGAEVRDLLSSASIDLFSAFGDACRSELARLRPVRIGVDGS